MTRSSDAAPSPDPVGSARTLQPVLVDTAVGAARLWVHRPAVPSRCVLVLGHGAGRGADTPDLLALSQALPRHGVVVVRLDQPWVVAGRRVAGAPAHLDRAWLAAVPLAQELAPAGLPLVVGGRSAGARVACRTAAELGAVGVVAVAFPLHPPGRPERTRVGELVGSQVRTLVVQGERDAFGGPAEVLAALPRGSRGSVEVVALEQADHSLRVPARAAVTVEETLGALVRAVEEWLPGRRPV